MAEWSIVAVSKTVMGLRKFIVGSNPTMLTHPFSFKTNKMNKQKKFIRVETCEVGRVDGMVVLWPSNNSYEKYVTPYYCFFDVGDRVFVMDTKYYNSHMTDQMIYRECFANKHYRLGEIISRGCFCLVCSNGKHLVEINRNQMFAEKVTVKLDDGEEFTCSPLYFALLGRIVNEDEYNKSTSKIYNKSEVRFTDYNA